MSTLPYYEAYASEMTAPHLVLVHGFLSSRAQWRANLSALSRVSRPVCIELWGHGRSPAPTDPAAYRVDAYLQAFETVRRQLRVRSWYICGQSFAAGLVAQYSLLYPDSVRGQIITNSTSAFAPVARNRSNDEQARRADAIKREGRSAIEMLSIHPRHATRIPAAIQDELIADAAMASPLGIANSIRYTAPGLSVIGCWHNTVVPTLLVNGRWEKAFQPLRDHASKLAGRHYR